MSRGCLCLLLTWAVAWVLMSPGAAAGGDRFGLLGGHRLAGLPGDQGSAYGVSIGPPGPHRFPEYQAGGYPWYGYGFGVPTYSWGYFGARYRPGYVSHKGYYGDYTQWGYRRGY